MWLNVNLVIFKLIKSADSTPTPQIFLFSTTQFVYSTSQLLQSWAPEYSRGGDEMIDYITKQLDASAYLAINGRDEDHGRAHIQIHVLIRMGHLRTALGGTIGPTIYERSLLGCSESSESHHSCNIGVNLRFLLCYLLFLRYFVQY